MILMCKRFCDIFFDQWLMMMILFSKNISKNKTKCIYVNADFSANFSSPSLACLASSIWDLTCAPFSGWCVLNKKFLDRVRKVVLSALDPQRLTYEWFCPLFLTCCFKRRNHSGSLLIKSTSTNACTHGHTVTQAHTLSRLYIHSCVFILGESMHCKKMQNEIWTSCIYWPLAQFPYVWHCFFSSSMAGKVEVK